MPRSQETKVGAIARECLGLRVRLVNRALSTIYDDALRPCGLKISQFTILVVIANYGTVRPAGIGDFIQMDSSTLSRNLERIRRQNWIEVVQDDRDARAHPVRLTAEGRRLLDRAMPKWQEAQEQARRRLGETGVRALEVLAETVMKG